MKRSVLITGGGGFIGRKLARQLLQAGSLWTTAGEAFDIGRLTLFDTAAPEALPDDLRLDPRLDLRSGDIAAAGAADGLVDRDTAVVFHMAAVVSAGAEEDFELGMAVNMDGTRALLDRARTLGTCPRFLFASSVAVFGGAMPAVVEDGTAVTPQTSYGTQKAIGELLINDYSRKGYVDGRAIRLPTVVVRPGRPNKAASSFASSIIREPLQGQEALCPVPPDQKMWLISPRRAVDAFVRAAAIPAAEWGENRILTLPGITRTVREMVDAMTAVAGAGPAKRIRWERDPAIERIVAGWATTFHPRRGLAMGFEVDASMEAVVEAFIADELGGRAAA